MLVGVDVLILTEATHSHKNKMKSLIPPFPFPPIAAKNTKGVFFPTVRKPIDLSTTPFCNFQLFACAKKFLPTRIKPPPIVIKMLLHFCYGYWGDLRGVYNIRSPIAQNKKSGGYVWAASHRSIDHYFVKRDSVVEHRTSSLLMTNAKLHKFHSQS